MSGKNGYETPKLVFFDKAFIFLYVLPWILEGYFSQILEASLNFNIVTNLFIADIFSFTYFVSKLSNFGFGYRRACLVAFLSALLVHLAILYVFVISSEIPLLHLIIPFGFVFLFRWLTKNNLHNPIKPVAYLSVMLFFCLPMFSYLLPLPPHSDSQDEETVYPSAAPSPSPSPSVALEEATPDPVPPSPSPMASESFSHCSGTWRVVELCVPDAGGFRIHWTYDLVFSEASFTGKGKKVLVNGKAPTSGERRAESVITSDISGRETSGTFTETGYTGYQTAGTIHLTFAEDGRSFTGQTYQGTKKISDMEGTVESAAATPSDTLEVASDAALQPVPPQPGFVAVEDKEAAVTFNVPRDWTSRRGSDPNNSSRTALTYTSPDSTVTVGVLYEDNADTTFVSDMEKEMLKDFHGEMTGPLETIIAGEKCRHYRLDEYGQTVIARIFTHKGKGYGLVFMLPTKDLKSWENDLDTVRISFRFMEAP